MFLSLDEYPPLTSSEIEAIPYRVQFGEPLTGEELDGLHRQRSESAANL
jgi:hypothetical protein